MNVRMSSKNVLCGSSRLLRHNICGITAAVARLYNRFSVDFQDQIFLGVNNLNLNHECLYELQHNILFGSL